MIVLVEAKQRGASSNNDRCSQTQGIDVRRQVWLVSGMTILTLIDHPRRRGFRVHDGEEWVGQ